MLIPDEMKNDKKKKEKKDKKKKDEKKKKKDEDEEEDIEDEEDEGNGEEFNVSLSMGLFIVFLRNSSELIIISSLVFKTRNMHSLWYFSK